MPTITLTRRGDRWAATTTVDSPTRPGVPRAVLATGRTATRALENLLARPSVDRAITPTPKGE